MHQESVSCPRSPPSERNDSYLTFDPNTLICDPTSPTTELTNGVNEYMAALAIIKYSKQLTALVKPAGCKSKREMHIDQWPEKEKTAFYRFTVFSSRSVLQISIRGIVGG